MSNKKDSLGDRMKENYENRSKTYLVRRMPVIIRLDGRAFHTFTKGFKRPYDEIFHNAMNDTVKYLCENIQGCKIGYTQSDEITLLLTDYENLDTAAWFDYAVEKMCSISASMATLAFNKALRIHFEEYICKILNEYDSYDWPQAEIKYCDDIENALEKGAMFDARVFNIPKEEVINCFLWRFLDCYRNSVQMLGQTYFNHKQLYKLSSAQIQEKLFQECGINYAHCKEEFKNGICCYKDELNKWKLEPMPDPRKNQDFFEKYFKFD